MIFSDCINRLNSPVNGMPGAYRWGERPVCAWICNHCTGQMLRSPTRRDQCQPYHFFTVGWMQLTPPFTAPSILTRAFCVLLLCPALVVLTSCT